MPTRNFTRNSSEDIIVDIFISKLSNGTTTYTIKDANAYHQGDLATVATSGNYTDLINKPTIDQTYDPSSTNAQSGTAVAEAIANKVTKTTGNYQIYGTNGSGVTTSYTMSSGNVASTIVYRTAESQVRVATTPTGNNDATSKKYVDDGLGAINNKIPSAATSSNQLADKDFVNSSIDAIAAYYITSDVEGDAFATKATLDTGPYYHDGSTRTPTENDYAIVAADETHDNACTRYSYTGSQWSFQYVVNDTPFTQAQINAINSGVTNTLVGNYNTHIADTTIHVTSADKTNWDNAVHKTGNESISGTKTFNDTLELKNNLSFRSYGTNNSGRLQFRAQPSDNVIRGTVAITDGYSISGSGYSGFVAQMVARAGSTTSDPFNTMRVSNKGIEYIKEANDGTITGQYIIVDDNGLVPSDRLATSGSTGQVLTKTASGQSWQTIDALPSQSGQSGKYLTTNGTTVSWATVDALPAQSGQSGKYLTTNGSTASWSSISYNNLTNKLTAGTDINISNSNVISSTHPEVYLTQAQYEALIAAGTVDENTYYNTPNTSYIYQYDPVITIKSSMASGDPLPEGSLVLVEAS